MDLMHPVRLGDHLVWRDDSINDLDHKLKYGDATKGWEGDPRLFIMFDEIAERFELWRMEDDGNPRMVCRPRRGDVKFDERLIDVLIEHDRHREAKGLHERIVETAEAKEAAETRLRHEYIEEEFAPKLRWALNKDGA